MYKKLLIFGDNGIDKRTFYYSNYPIINYHKQCRY